MDDEAFLVAFHRLQLNTLSTWSSWYYVRPHRLKVLFPSTLAGEVLFAARHPTEIALSPGVLAFNCANAVIAKDPLDMET